MNIAAFMIGFIVGYFIFGLTPAAFAVIILGLIAGRAAAFVIQRAMRRE